ncbi:biotin biosynthesis cytochrome P450-like enzyme [Mycolicibacterium fortuitum]|uniref:Steroid C26-monooxygenase n=1 Tax=Mycolicibacterium fortuitum TaxID=1766 RepID=A0A378UCL9_MYCFO|nr:biotin biosynthesis cytochrome P450-like enzyme [Mycolicibacterium fortuitum]
MIGTAPSVFDADVPALTYTLGETPFEVYPRIRAAQRRAPMAVGPIGVEILSYDLARTVLRDNRFRIPPGLHLAVQGITSGPLWDKFANSLLCMEGDAHQRVRGLVSRAFTPRATARLHETITEVIGELVERATASGRCDVVAEIARPYPVPIICALIGAPREDWQQFSLWADDVFKAMSLNIGDDEQVVMTAWGELDAYVDDMVAERRRELTDDLLSDLIRAEDGGDRLSADELRMLVAGLLLAGTDTTRNQVAASIDVLCDHPEQWSLLRNRPELAMRAVDETMRHSPVVCGALRITTRDVELEGLVIPAGTLVMVNTFAANRDQAIYDDPETFDISRDDVPPILTFGGGLHYCLGANLARLEVAEALVAMTRRLPSPRRDEPAPWKPMMGMSGPVTLPLEFTDA